MDWKQKRMGSVGCFGQIENIKRQSLSILLTDTTPIRDLFEKPKYNIVDELDGSTEPTLFNC